MNQFMTFREQLFQGDATQSAYHTSCKDEFQVKILKPKKIVESLKKKPSQKSKGPGPGSYNLMVFENKEWNIKQKRYRFNQKNITRYEYQHSNIIQ